MFSFDFWNIQSPQDHSETQWFATSFSRTQRNGFLSEWMQVKTSKRKIQMKQTRFFWKLLVRFLPVESKDTPGHPGNIMWQCVWTGEATEARPRARSPEIWAQAPRHVVPAWLTLPTQILVFPHHTPWDRATAHNKWHC